MIRMFVLLAAQAAAIVGVAACVTPPPPATPEQRMYEAFSIYSAALSAAVSYAEGPTADPAIVRGAAILNGAPPIRAARSFARAFVLCRGRREAIIAGVDCLGLDLRPDNLTRTAIALRDVAVKLLDPRS